MFILADAEFSVFTQINAFPPNGFVPAADKCFVIFLFFRSVNRNPSGFDNFTTKFCTASPL